MVETLTDSKAFLQSVKNKMGKSVEHTLHMFSTLHTGKASPSMVENIAVDTYGSSMKIKEIAATTTPDPRTITIQPWDKSMISAIEKAIQKSNLGIHPISDGIVVRCPIPELSRERRQELAKTCKGMAEDGKVAVRSARREAIDVLKKAEKDGEISEDDLRRMEKEVQKSTDNSISEIDKHLSAKESELLSI